jgi:hypothetical protein
LQRSITFCSKSRFSHNAMLYANNAQ